MSCDFEIEIRSTAALNVYEVEVDSPAGSAIGTVRLPVSELLGRRREVAASVLASAVTSRSTLPALERPIREMGSTLFAAVVVDRVRSRYAASVQEAARRGEPLRVVLRLRAPELAALPWEAVFDVETEEYLCQREPLVRYVEAAEASTPLTVKAPLRILGLVAAPTDLPGLNVEEEQRRLGHALRGLAEQGLVELVWAPSGSWSALQDLLQRGPWHVVHFVGHGGTDAAHGGVLALEHEDTRQAVHVSARRFARLLHACRPVPRLVVLNACSSGESAADDLLSSTAASVVHSGISASVAMQFAVTDPAALAFARGFYRALGQNAPVDEAVRLGRIAIDGTSEETLEWVTPVLYLRTAETRLFEVQALGARGASEQARPQGDEIAREATLYGLYVQAMAAIRTEQYQEAIALLDSLLTLDPGYRDAAERRASADRRQRMIQAYDRGRAAEEAGDWDTARRAFEAVISLEPDYRDAAARHDACRRRQDITSLQDELRLHAAAQRWTAVLAVNDQLDQLDPSSADPEGLASRASEELEGERSERERTEEQARADERARSRRSPEVIHGPARGPAVEPGEPPGRPPDASTGRRRMGARSRMLFAAAGLLLAGLGVAVVVATTQDVDKGSRGSPEPKTPSGSPDPKPTGPDDDPGEPGTRCWNGASRASLDECPPVRGVAGMKWLFPTLAKALPGCRPAGVYGGKLRAFGCDATTPGGPSARVVYSEWTTFDVGDAHYRAKYGPPDRTNAQFNIWSTTRMPSNFQTSRMFAERLPFSVTVESSSEERATELMRQLDFRSRTETAPYR